MDEILVMGAAGFIGHHLTTRLLNQGQHVVGYDRIIPQAFEGRKNYTHICGDFTAERDFEAIFDKHSISCIYHCISTTTPREGIDHVVDEGEQNIIATLRLLKSLAKYDGMKLIFLSSGGTVYGENSGMPSKIGDENTPVCTYGIQKRTIEMYIEYFTRNTGLNGLIARLSNPYGVIRMQGRTQGIIPIFLNNLRDEKGVTLYGDTVRDYIHIDDVVDALVALKDYTGNRFLFNIGSGKGVRLSKLIEMLQQITGKKFVTIEERQIRSCDVQTNILDIEETTGELGWEPRVPLEKGIEMVWKEIC